MKEVAEWQEILDNHVKAAGSLQSFEERTGYRTKLPTRLGPRRTASDPVSRPYAPFRCSVISQDCPTGLACYGSMTRSCAVPGKMAAGEACARNSDCMSGHACPYSISRCAAYCEPLDAASPRYCPNFCSSGFAQLADATGAVVGGFCRLQ